MKPTLAASPSDPKTRPASKFPKLPAGKKLANWIIGCVFLLLFTAVGFWFNPGETIDPEVQDIRNDMKQAFNRENRDKTPEQRREQFQQMRERVENLTPEQKKQFEELMAAEQLERELKPARDWHNLPPEDRQAHIDNTLRQEQVRMQEMRKRMEEWRKQQAANPQQGQGNPGARGPGQGQRGPGQGQRGPGAGGPGGPGRGSRGTQTAEQRAQRMRNRVDRSSVEQRAIMSAYREAVRERREALGMGSPWGGRR